MILGIRFVIGSFFEKDLQNAQPGDWVEGVKHSYLERRRSWLVCSTAKTDDDKNVNISGRRRKWIFLGIISWIKKLVCPYEIPGNSAESIELVESARQMVLPVIVPNDSCEQFIVRKSLSVDCSSRYFVDCMGTHLARASNRQGILCGECKPNFSEALGTQVCTYSSKCKGLGWFLPVSGALSLFYVLVIVWVPMGEKSLWKSITYFLQVWSKLFMT